MTRSLESRLPPRLKVGERVRLTPGGPVRQIVRVTPCAAYYGYEVSRTFPVMDRRTGEVREITRTEHRAEAISAHAFVERVTEEAA
jgi:hypothetical protein